MPDSLYVVFGGALGCLVRYWCTQWATILWGNQFPYGTVLVNILGCFLIGLLAGLPQGFSFLPYPLRLLLVIGFLGGFTTFSSYTFNTFELLQTGQVFKAAFNALGSVFIGLIALYIGYFVIQLAYASISK